MQLDQISVFLENKPGKLSEFIHILAENHIDLLALSIAETPEYGILRIIVDKPEETTKVLRDNSFSCKLTSVLSVTVNDEPGSLTRILSALADNGISLQYSYAFLARQSGSACVILRVDDNERAEKVLASAGIAF